jgi:hypothetical protein
MKAWTSVCEMNQQRQVTAGSTTALADAIRRGADLRSFTTFNWADHMGTFFPDQGLVEETMDWRICYLIEDRWVAAVMCLRYPANGGLGFGKDPSLSFFLYNQDGQFGIARPFFDKSSDVPRNPLFSDLVSGVQSSYRVIDAADQDTISPSHNATYEFGCYKWIVRDDWQELLSHDAEGRVLSGSLAKLTDAFREGCSIKVGVRDLCGDMTGRNAMGHEVFIELGSMYNHKEQGFFSGESMPLVRVTPSIPVRYASGNWNCGWILPRTDGQVFHLVVDPYTRKCVETSGRKAIRWFAR